MMEEVLAFVLLGIAILFLTFMYFDYRVTKLEQLNDINNIEEQAR
jgi:hypothetical protein